LDKNQCVFDLNLSFWQENLTSNPRETNFDREVPRVGLAESAVRKRDPMGYYAALNISPDATAAEIRLSYTFIKQSYHEERRHVDVARIRAAYEILSDPSARREYDNDRATRGGAPAWMSSMSLRQILVPILAVTGLLLLVIVGPTLRAQFRSFESGDEIYWVENGESLGKVLSFERDHRFPSGAEAPAFEILPASGEDPLWYPARDLKRYGRTR
jgi:curved DNA-binding protein CbpA